MEEDRKIKKFGEFMHSAQRRSLNRIIVYGKTIGGFFSRSKDFEIKIYHTNRNRIVECVLKDITLSELKELGLEIHIGDRTDSIKTWSTKNKFKFEEIENNI